MQRRERVSAIQRQAQTSKLRKPTHKELDLLVLAGCSCLLTMLHHPVAEALQSHAIKGTGAAIATQTGRTSTNSMNAFHLVLPSRDEKEG